jgi:hypothetical protein
LDLNNPNVSLIPSVTIGSPITLETLGAPTLAAILVDNTATAGSSLEIQKFSQRAMLTTNAATTFNTGDALVLPIGTTVAELQAFVADTASLVTDPDQKFVVFNYDVRSIFDNNAGGATTVTVTIRETATPLNARILDNGVGISSQGEVLLTAADVLAITDGTTLTTAAGTIEFVFTGVGGGAASAIAAGTVMPVVADIF